MFHGWRNARRLYLAPLLAGLFFAGVGCTRTDPDNLASIGRKLADRTRLVSDGLEQTWTTFSGQVVIENRVKARLHWDKSLADSSIEVHATDRAVELKGTLPSHAHVRRAVELAESTVGVDKVVSSLQVERRE